jgi:hypothetical protein
MRIEQEIKRRHEACNEWLDKVNQAREALAYFTGSLEQWRDSGCTDQGFMRAIRELDAAGLLTGLDSPELDGLREAVVKDAQA